MAPRDRRDIVPRRNACGSPKTTPCATVVNRIRGAVVSAVATTAGRRSVLNEAEQVLALVVQVKNHGINGTPRPGLQRVDASGRRVVGQHRHDDQQQETKECRGAERRGPRAVRSPHASLASSDFSRGRSTEAWLGGAAVPRRVTPAHAGKNKEVSQFNRTAQSAPTKLSPRRDAPSKHLWESSPAVTWNARPDFTVQPRSKHRPLPPPYGFLVR